MTKQERININYNNIHSALIKKHGNAKHCSNKDCSYENPKRFEWALLRGKTYSNDIADYIPLCPSCHRKYDDNPETRKKLSEDHKGKLYHNRSRRVIRIDKHGNVSEYESVLDAARKNNISDTSIWHTLKGRQQHSGGFKWKLK